MHGTRLQTLLAYKVQLIALEVPLMSYPAKHAGFASPEFLNLGWQKNCRVPWKAVQPASDVKKYAMLASLHCRIVEVQRTAKGFRGMLRSMPGPIKYTMLSNS
jgi:hypothetical protein